MIFSLLIVCLIIIEYLTNTGIFDISLGNALKASCTFIVFLIGIRTKLPKGLWLYAALMMLLVIKTIMHPNVNWGVSLRESFKLIVLPFWLIFTVNRKAKVNLVLWFVLGISLLTYVHLIPAGGAVYDLSIYESSAEGFVGIFANAHSAGLSYVALSSIALVSFLRFRSNAFLILMFLFGTFGFLSFVRTAWVPLIVIIVYALTKISNNKKVSFFLVMIALIVVVFTALQSEIFLDRLLDRNKFRQISGVENLGSNRVLLWLTNLNIISNSSWWNVIWGLGRERAFIEMEQILGFSKASHNVILDILVRDGVLGVIIYLSAIRQLVVWVKNNSIKGLSSVFNILFFSWFFFQGTSFFMFDVFMALYITEILKYTNEVYLRN